MLLRRQRERHGQGHYDARTGKGGEDSNEFHNENKERLKGSAVLPKEAIGGRA